MTLTRANTELILIRRVGTLLTAVGLDGTTVDGSNVDLNDPIATGVIEAGGTVASRVLVTDADVATVADAYIDELLDVSELRTLQTCYNVAVTLIDTKIGPRDEKWSNLATTLKGLVDAKQKVVDDTYLSSNSTISAAVVDYDFSTLD